MSAVAGGVAAAVKKGEWGAWVLWRVEGTADAGV